MRNEIGYTPTTNPDRSPLNNNIEELLSDRQLLLILPTKHLAVMNDDSLKHKTELSGIMRPGKLLSKAKTCSSITRECEWKHIEAVKTKPNKGDESYNEMEISDLTMEGVSIRAFEYSNRSISEIREDEECKEEFMSAMSIDRSYDLRLEQKNIDLTEENSKLRLENEILKRESQSQILALKKELERAKNELNNTLKRSKHNP